MSEPCKHERAAAESSFLKFVEKTIYKAQCVECKAKFPDKKTRVVSQRTMRDWRLRHQKLTDHTIRTAVTYVRRYD